MDVHRPVRTPTGLTVVLVHGGFWRERYRRDLMDPLVPSLLADGHLVVNLEYRRVGGAGGWPTTLTDVATGLDAVAGLAGVDPARVATVGHSAGGHLAMWLAARHRLPAGAPGADPVVRPCHVVGLAPVVVLADAVAADLGDGAVRDLLGGDDRERRRVADPSAWLPLGVPATLLHAPADEDVPVQQSERWLALAAEAGDEARLVTAPGDHYSVIDPDHELWQATLASLRELG
jgi:acetyl esterase/lipase